MRWQLTVTQGAQKGKVVSITRSVFTIGRDRDCHLRPVSTLVSRRHCDLTLRAGRLFVIAHASANGTRVNGELAAGERELRKDDLLQVGPLCFRVTAQVEGPSPGLPARPRKAGAADEDAVAAMLMELDRAAEPSAGEDSPASVAATLRDGPSLSCQDTSAGQVKESKSKSPPGARPAAAPSTADAAEALLGKYRGRDARAYKQKQ